MYSAGNTTIKAVALTLGLFVATTLGAQATGDSAHESDKHLAGYNRGGESLRKKLALSPDKSVKVYRYAPAEGRLENSPAPSSKQMWKNHACQADAIVMASVSSIKSLLSADESQVFTDYKMTPLAITKGDNLIPGVSFYLTQPGGIVHIDGGEITDLGAEYPSPLLPNEVYLLFLKTTKSTNTFRPLDNLSTYLLDSYRIRTITESADRDSMNNFLWNLSPDSLPTTLRQNLLTCSTGTSSPATSDLSQ